MNTLDGNKFIAEFLGFKACKCVRNGDSGRYYDYHAHPSFSCIQEQEIQIEGENGWGLVEQDFLFIEDLKFHTSWDWITPVVEKIENTQHDTALTGHYVTIVGLTCEIKPAAGFHKDAFRETVFSETKLDATYKAVLSFIEWYNKQK